MKHDYECNVHLKANGEPDVEYYVLEANRMSSEIISGFLRSIASWIKKQLKKIAVAPLRNAFND